MDNWRENPKASALMQALEATDTAAQQRGFYTGGDIYTIMHTISELRSLVGSDIDKTATEYKNKINAQFSSKQGGQL